MRQTSRKNGRRCEMATDIAQVRADYRAILELDARADEAHKLTPAQMAALVALMDGIERLWARNQQCAGKDDE